MDPGIGLVTMKKRIIFPLLGIELRPHGYTGTPTILSRFTWTA
jgi:hypothetical protein